MWPLFLFLLGGAAGSLKSSSEEASKKVTQPQQQQFAGQGSNVQRLPDIYWNTTNPMFRIDNTDHIIDVNRGHGRTFHQYDQVNIICPVYSIATPPELMEKFIIYGVNKEEYDTCRIMSTHPRILAQCDSPLQFRVFTISFRFFSPTPGAIEFRPGKDYYFISTSSRDDLHQRVDGMCRDNNMKVVFKVADNSKLPPVISHVSKSSKGRIEDDIVQDKSSEEQSFEGKKRETDKEATPKPFDYFLHQAKDKDEKNLLNDLPDQTLKEGTSKKKSGEQVKQEASTSSAGRAGLAVSLAAYFNGMGGLAFFVLVR